MKRRAPLDFGGLTATVAHHCVTYAVLMRVNFTQWRFVALASTMSLAPAGAPPATSLRVECECSICDRQVASGAGLIQNQNDHLNRTTSPAGACLEPGRTAPEGHGSGNDVDYYNAKSTSPALECAMVGR